ncbi:MAG: SLC13 family permease [Chloroflexus sp.]|uniref:SLC13 family permease n=1 Tax=Chloroflexus sp. TaxID=1904827 RepID=UPI0021DEFFA2|nr:SLC13 family permease [Chloroflexus sp.]GIV89526.1 MAG: SLC13 family permease [Chloroflexus sp.]
MTTAIAFVFTVLATMIVLFVSDRLRLDLVAIMGMLALLLGGILTPAEAVAGFGDTTVLLIAALMIVGDGLLQTGVAAWIGQRLGQIAGVNERRILVTLMIPVAILSAFISSTGTVAIMLPIAINIARQAGISPSRLLLPIAYAALTGGMLTLVGTPPNIIAAEALIAVGRPSLGFFSFTPIGSLVIIAVTLVMVLFGNWLLPMRVVSPTEDTHGPTLAELVADYRLTEGLAQVRVAPDSPLAGLTLAEARLHSRYGVTVVGIRRWSDGQAIPSPARAVTAATRILAGDLLDVIGDDAAIATMCRTERVIPQTLQLDLPFGPELHVMEVALTPRSRFIGQTVATAELRQRFGVTVLGARRLGLPFTGDLAHETLRFGDTLLVAGSPTQLTKILNEQRTFGDLAVVALPRDLSTSSDRFHRRAWLAIAIVVAMLVLMTGGWLPTVTVALLAAVAMVLSGCVPINDVYRRLSWESLVLIAAMLPMATALTKTGGAALIARELATALGTFSPLVVLAGIFIITSFLSQFISNTATSVLMMPIALGIAQQLGLAPEPFVITAAIAASTAFSTPIASPVNTLVLVPGGYRFADYARAGIPLQVVVLVICLLVIPFLFPW